MNREINYYDLIEQKRDDTYIHAIHDGKYKQFRLDRVLAELYADDGQTPPPTVQSAPSRTGGSPERGKTHRKFGTCGGCGSGVRLDAMACPNCGVRLGKKKKLKQPITQRGFVWGLVAGVALSFALLMAIGMMAGPG